MYAYMNAYHPASSVFFVLQIFFVPLYSVQIFQSILGIEVEPLQDYKQQARNSANLGIEFVRNPLVGRT